MLPLRMLRDVAGTAALESSASCMLESGGSSGFERDQSFVLGCSLESASGCSMFLVAQKKQPVIHLFQLV